MAKKWGRRQLLQANCVAFVLAHGGLQGHLSIQSLPLLELQLRLSLSPVVGQAQEIQR